jgi:hypothetical protein
LTAAKAWAKRAVPKLNDVTSGRGTLRHSRGHRNPDRDLRDGSGHLDSARSLVPAEDVPRQDTKTLVPGLFGRRVDNCVSHQIRLMAADLERFSAASDGVAGRVNGHYGTPDDRQNEQGED